MQRFYHFCIRFLQISSFVLFAVLAVLSFFATAYIETPYEFVITLGWDNPLLNLLFLCCFLVLLYGLEKLFSRIRHGNTVLLVLTCFFVFCVSLLWSAFSKNGPVADGSSIYYAAKQFAVNDFSAISYRDSYFSVYPFQLGLAFLYEMIFRLVRNDNYHILQGVNSLCLVLCTVSQYFICGRLFREKKAQIYTLLLTAFCAPLIMYSSFIYGEIPSFAFLLFGTWMLFVFLDISVPDNDSAQKQRLLSPAFKILCGILAVFSIACSVLIRKNSLVFMVALGIILVLWLYGNRNSFSVKKAVLYTAYIILLFALAIGILPMVQNRYAKRSGQTINSGIPASTYLAMGLMEANAAPGHYNTFNFNTFTIEADYDAEVAAKLGWEAYRERLSYFISNPGYALSFLGMKFCSEWIDVGWAVFPATYNTFGERLPVVESLFSGPLHAPLVSYIANYQMVLYLSAAVCTFILFRTKKRKENIFVYLFPLTAFGGALLFLAWEGSGRYILPYAIFMLPCAGYGAQQLIYYTGNILSARLKRHVQPTIPQK